MTRLLLLVPDRSSGWRETGTLPLLDSAEASAHAAFTAAGVTVDVAAAGAFLENAAVGTDLTVLIQPKQDLMKRIERKVASDGGILMVVHQEESEETLKRVRDSGLAPVSSGVGPIPICRRSRHGRAMGWRSRLLSPSFVALRSTPQETVMATWKSSDLPALRVRESGKARIWSLGFHPDHLERAALLALLGMVGEGRIDHSSLREPVPEGASAVVLLLHDVEDPLPDDPDGIESVRTGLEAGLDAEARHGLHATYNAVGTFAEKIPDLIKRIVTEGHELASHGATHRVVADLDPATLRQEVEGCESRLLGIAGVRIRGFRSPRSRWSDPLLNLLAEREYRWNAEVDASPFPYRVPGRGSSSLVRIPVAVDDWDFVKHRASPRRVRNNWEREVRWAMERRSWVAIGSHPSVLGAAAGRLSMFGDFLGWLSSEKVRVLTHDECVTWWLKRITDGAAATDELRLPVAGRPA